MAQIVNSQEFDSYMTGDAGLVLVDFYADWCGPCKMMAPVVDKIGENYAGKAKVIKVNVDNSSDVAARFGIMSIPTFILFKNGKEVKKIIGGVPQEMLETAINENL